MNDRHDIVDIEGLEHLQPNPDRAAGAKSGPKRPFLQVWFRCCHVYGRLYRNRTESAYEGRCPRCGGRVGASIGPDGTSRRLFEAW